MSEAQQEVTEQEAPAEITAESLADTSPDEAEADSTTEDNAGEGEQKVSGTEFAEFSTPQEKARFNRVWRNMKEYEGKTEAHAKTIEEQNRALRAAADRIAALEARDDQDKISGLETKRRQAMENGDYEAEQRLNAEIMEYRIAEKMGSNREKIEIPEPAPVDQNPLSDHDMDQVRAWALEKDSTGRPIRPWASPNHPQWAKVDKYIQSGVLDPDLYDGQGLDKLLGHIDKKMNGGKPRTAAVLSNSGSGRPKTPAGAVKLTPEEMRVADGMGYSHEKYATLLKNHAKGDN